MPENGKRAKAQSRSFDEVVNSVLDVPSLALVTQDGAPAPDYTKGFVVAGIAADQSDPNAVAPTATLMATGSFGAILWHMDWPNGGSGDVEVWVDGGKDVAGDAIGWLLVDKVVNAPDRKEFRSNVGLRVSAIRLVNTAGLGVGSPAKVRAAPVL